MKKPYVLVILVIALVVAPLQACSNPPPGPAQVIAATPTPSGKTYEEYINDSLTFYTAGDYQKSIEVAQSALQLQPDSAVAYNNICAAYNALQQWDQAITACGKSVASDPNFALAKNNLGEALRGKMAGTPSAQDTPQQTAAAPDAGEQWAAAINASLTFYQAGDYLKSIEAAQKALAVKPDSAIAYNNICAAYNQLKEWDKAIEACQQALAIQPDFELAKNNLRAAQEARTAGTPAAQVTSQQLAATPAAGDPWAAAISESLAYYQSGDYRKSLEAAQKALAVKPDSAIAYNNICAAYNALKQWDDAIAACGHALAIDPNFELAKNNLGVAVQAKQSQ
jgi:tetratricopeptide (TPR) repeat protein